ncbi:MAG: hypothetical protein R3356_05425, partial [Eudoraea sp.]|nr:hypothetical protein [Eudoraea sp.]
DAFDPSWDSNLQKLIQTVSATLEIVLREDDIKLPEVGRQARIGQKKKSIIRIAVGALLTVLLLFAGWYVLPKLIPSGDSKFSTHQLEVTQTIEPDAADSTSDSNPLPPDWKTPAFTIPGNGLWKEDNGKYTAIGSVETIAWSEEKYSGDIEISMEIESSNAFAAANIVVYGNGFTLSSGNLIFTVANDILAIVEGSIYEENDYSYTAFSGPNFVQEKHTVLVKVVDRKATLFVDSVEISSVFLKDSTDNEGKIGLLKYWEIDEITFSNIRVKGTESP